MIGSSALSGLMLDLGLLKIIWGGVFPFLAPMGTPNPAGPYTDPFPNPAGQSLPLLNLTCPKLSINSIIFNNPKVQKWLDLVHFLV